jgi:Domain of unknown function (DUF3883)
MTANEALLARIRDENLGVYRESPKRLREDVAQEAEIAHDYRGRLVYELLQNADDAMLGQGNNDDRVIFWLTRTDLWVGNTGRPLDDRDVEGLCGTGISSKTQTDGPKRASIGHKGMGFKSVLEVTNRPAAYSVGHSFRMSAEDALAPVKAVFQTRGESKPARVPAMRFPWPNGDDPAEWQELRAEGIQTLFRFPLRADLTSDQRRILGDRLRQLPITALIFLKHLEQVDIKVDDDLGDHRISIRIEREIYAPGAWTPTVGLDDDGIFRISIRTDGGGTWAFMLAHDAHVPIAGHRGGLDPFSWEGIELTEVAVATPWPVGEVVPPGFWQRFHVFLPTEEELPFPLLVNGAFATDLSRQKIRVGPEADDYNHYLAERAAVVLRDRLVPAVLAEATPEAVLAMLDRSGAALTTPIADAFYKALRSSIADLPFVPAAGEQGVLSVSDVIVPPTRLPGNQGSEYRALLPDDVSIGNTSLPAARFCDSAVGSVLVDLGARALTEPEAVQLLAKADPEMSRIQDHPSAKISIDPVLTALERLWRASSDEDRPHVEDAARRAPLFPVSVGVNRSVERISTLGIACFYPPRSFSGGVPLDRLCFLAPQVCWGELAPPERNEALRDQRPMWQALFGIVDFKFPDVMRASVLPALDLEQGTETAAWRRSLEDIDRLAAICQLAGRTPKPNSPLPYQRLGSDRALFNLARLSVPVRPGPDGAERWAPAFRVYFGRDWINSASVEPIFDALRAAEPEAAMPNIDYIAPPEQFRGLLGRHRALEGIADETSEAVDQDEVALDENEEVALEDDELERWRTFLAWLGVNTALRPIHFHDVEEQRGGWTRTLGLGKPSGAAFATVGDKVWGNYRAWIDKMIAQQGTADFKAYFYELFELEHAKVLIDAASRDREAIVAEALFRHLAENWSYLEQFSKLKLALLPADRDPARRSQPIRPRSDEVRDVTSNFWLWRLQRRPVVPTSRGPRLAGRSWTPSPEIDRRFARRAIAAGDLIPVVRLPSGESREKARRLAKVLGVRDEFSPATFRSKDAEALADRLVERYQPPGASPESGFAVDEKHLRQVIRPAYRNLFELLVGEIDRHRPGDQPLKHVPLLETDGAERYRFKPGSEVLYQDRTGTRERIGPAGQVWTFVLEATPSARSPLVQLFGARLLEDAVEWDPKIGQRILDDSEVERFRAGLRELRPYILAQLRAERNEEQMVRQDARRLDDFIERVEPVEELTVACRLGGHLLSVASPRDAFVAQVGGRVTAFVRWGEVGWPASSRDSEVLAGALTDLFQLPMFDSFLAMISARTHDERIRRLRLAGAPTDLNEVLAGIDEGEDQPSDEAAGSGNGTSAPGTDPSDEEPALPREPTGERGSVPLWLAEELFIGGSAVVITGSLQAKDASDAGNNAGAGHRAGESGFGGAGYGSLATNLVDLDRLGMHVAMSYEVQRIRAARPIASAFDPNGGKAEADAMVFDVHTPKAIEAAYAASPAFAEAFKVLRAAGLDPDWPGFDILTLDPKSGGIGRLIELKSSGVNANFQSMSWNEWKSARGSALRADFWLYLVGNLRSDLAGAHPFLRAIHDPFGTLLSTVVTEPMRRSIQLDVRRFETAEELEIGVKRKSAADAHSKVRRADSAVPIPVEEE